MTCHHNAARTANLPSTCRRTKGTSKRKDSPRDATGSLCSCRLPSIKVGTRPKESDVRSSIHSKSARTIPRPNTCRMILSWRSCKALQYIKLNPCRYPSRQSPRSSPGNPLQQTYKRLPDQHRRITMASAACHLSRLAVRSRAVGLLRQSLTPAPRRRKSTFPPASRRGSKHLQTRPTGNRLHK